MADVIEEHLSDGFTSVDSVLYSVDSVLCTEHQEVHQLLCEFADILYTGPHDLGCTDLVKQRINTSEASPIQQPLSLFCLQHCVMGTSPVILPMTSVLYKNPVLYKMILHLLQQSLTLV